MIYYMWNNDTGKYIRALRKKHHLTQQEFADMLSVSQTPVSRWESGEREISMDMLSRIAGIFDMELSELIADMEKSMKSSVTDPEKHIIVLEDVPVELRGIVSLIKRKYPGASVDGFERGAEALEFAENTPIDIAFLDIELSDGNGLEIAKKIHQLYPLSVVFMLTAHPEYAADAWDLHADGIVGGYILKPLTERRLANEINKAEIDLTGIE